MAFHITEVGTEVNGHTDYRFPDPRSASMNAYTKKCEDMVKYKDYN